MSTFRRFFLRRGTAAQWTLQNPILGDGEEGYEKDTGKRKVGDGTSSWSALGYNGADPAAVTQVASDLALHLSDLVDAHDASSISFIPAGTIAATDVQGALSEIAVDYLAADSALQTSINGKQPLSAGLTAYAASTVASPTGVAATDTTNIQAAIDAAFTAGGGAVILGAGTYVVNKITLKTLVRLVGRGRGVTVIQLANGANSNLIETFNFLTLTGTDTTSTPHSFGISDITLDGNASNQSGTSNGVAIYGYGYQLQRIVIRNTLGYGIWTEWGSASPYLGPDGMEAIVTDYMIHNTAAGGVYHMGPHDSQWINGFIVKNSGSGTGTYGIDIPVDGRSNGSTWNNLHIYGGLYAYCNRVVSSGILFIGCQFEGGQIGESWILASQVNMVECKWFTGGVNASTAKAIVVGDATRHPNNLRLTGKIENTGGGILDLTQSSGNNFIDLQAQFYAGVTEPNPAVIGTIDNNSTVKILMINNAGSATADSIVKFPTTVLSVGQMTASGFNGNLNATNTVSYPIAGNVNKTVRAESYLRGNAGSAGRSLVAGQASFCHFTPDATITVTTLSSVKTGTAAVGQTAAKMALYSVAANGDLTCIARTASDTALWTGADAINSRAIVDDGAASPNAISSVVLTRGQRYAFGCISVGASTPPQLMTSSAGLGTVAFLLPVVSSFGPAGVTDFAASYTLGQTSGTATMVYGYFS